MTGQATGTVTGQLDDQPEQVTGAQSLVRALEQLLRLNASRATLPSFPYAGASVQSIELNSSRF